MSLKRFLFFERFLGSYKLSIAIDYVFPSPKLFAALGFSCDLAIWSRSNKYNVTWTRLVKIYNWCIFPQHVILTILYQPAVNIYWAWHKCYVYYFWHENMMVSLYVYNIMIATAIKLITGIDFHRRRLLDLFLTHVHHCVGLTSHHCPSLASSLALVIVKFRLSMFLIREVEDFTWH